MDHPSVIVRHRCREQVEGNAQPLPGVQERGVITINNLPGRGPFGVRSHSDWGTMRVTARYHQYLIALKPMVPCKNVSGQIGASKVAEMKRAVGIRPSDPDENTIGHRVPRG